MIHGVQVVCTVVVWLGGFVEKGAAGGDAEARHLEISKQ
jgi:hypothetical protein